MKCIVLNKRRVLTLKKDATKTIEESVADLKAKGHDVRVVNYPSMKSLQKWSMDSICPTPDGCRVEPDGTCQHGYPSWLLLIGII